MIFRIDKKSLCYLLLVFMISSLYMAYSGLQLSGGVIAADEMVYFNLARKFSETFSYDFHQYNPLYPVLCSIFFAKGNLISAYTGIKIFNAFVFSSMVFPIFYTSRLLLTHKVWHYVLPTVAVALPWKIYTNLIWAEPLYFALYTWAVFIFCWYLVSQKKKVLGLLGCVSGLLFLTKQAGLLFYGTVILVLLLKVWTEKKEIRNALKEVIAFAIPGGVIILLWIIHNKIVGVGGLGYADEVENIKENLFNIKGIIYPFIYNITYYFVGTLFLPAVFTIYAVFNIKKMQKNEILFISLITVNSFLIMILSSFHYIGMAAPYGRYITVSIPYFIFIMLIVMQKKWKNNILLLLIAVIAGGTVLIFNPLPVGLQVKGYVIESDLSIWANLLLGKNRYYSVEQVKKILDHSYLMYAFILGSLLLCVVAVIAEKSRKYIVLFCMGLIVTATYFGNNSAVAVLAQNGNAENDLYRFFVQEKIDVSHIYKTNQGVGNKNIEKMWFQEENIRVADISTILNENWQDFDFGGENTPVTANSYGIQAPYITESFFDEINNLPGFLKEYAIVDGVSTIGALYNKEFPVNGSEDAIYGDKKSIFKMYKIAGEYSFRFVSNQGLMSQETNLGYKIYINNVYAGSITSDNSEVEFNYNLKKDGVVSIKFVPMKDCYWQISYMEVHAVQKLISEDIYIIAPAVNSSVPENYPIVFRNDKYRVYYKEK